MMQRFIEWLGLKLFPRKSQPKPRLNGIRAKSKPAPNRSRKEPVDGARKNGPSSVDFDSEVHGRIEDGGPGKNVLIRNKYVREDSGTHDNLKIIDESLLVPDEEDGFDPYNTGRFDKSKNWNSRTIK